MKRQLASLLVCGLLILGFVITVAVTSASTAIEQPIPLVVQDTPLPVLTHTQDISEWRMTSGFIYLTDNCRDGTSETSAYIQRRAIYGSLVGTLESITGSPQCRTFRHAAADESGIYYYNRNLGRLEAIYSDNPTAPPTTLATIGDWTRVGSGDGISALRLDGSYVYWIEVITNGEFNPDTISIKRLPKSGGTPTTLISYTTASQASFEGLGVTSTHIWWTDSNGLNRIDSCTLISCLPGPRVKTVEFPSISDSVGHIQVSGSNVFWWNEDELPEKIRKTRCSFVSGNCSTSTFYIGSSDTSIIGLAANNEAVYWVENVTFIGRRLQRQAISGGTAEIIADNVDLAAPYLDVDGVYFQQDIRTISRLSFDAEALTREIGIAGWEVTQGIQRLANDVPLVAGKTTYVRLYPTLEDGTDVGAVTAVLHGSHNGVTLPESPLYPSNMAIPVNAATTLADRGDLDSGWLFQLPKNWTHTDDGLIPQVGATLSLRAVIDPIGAYAASDDSSNNEITDDFSFIAKAPTCVTMRSVVTNNSYQSAFATNVGQVVELSEMVLPTTKLIAFPKNDPLREIDWCWKGPVYGPFCSTPYELNDDDTVLLTKMGWIDFWASSPSICYSNNARTLLAGIVHTDATWEWGGLARRGKDQLLTRVPKYGVSITRFNGEAMTMVHEIGHNYDRKHVDCGDPLNPDNNYPYPTDKLDFDLSLNHSDLHFGFDPLFQNPVIPTITRDFMSYCGPEWYSDYTWKAIFNKTRDPVFVPPQTPLATVAGDLVRIAGLIDTENNLGSLDYAWTLPAEATSNSQRQQWLDELTPAWESHSVAVSYHVQLLDSGGQVLADQIVETSAAEDGDEDASQPFELTMTAPTSTVARLQLMADSTILATLTPGSASPVVTIQQPIGGASIGSEITIDWTATDPDGDQLYYTIQYSPNGDEWYPLLVNYGGTGADVETVTLDFSGEAGSDGASALVRVLASDGYNMALATSQPFTVAKRAPFVAITNPNVGQTFATDETIPLNSFATDPEDGLIVDDQFIWSTGQTGQTAVLSGLAPGAHTLDLTVTDSDNLDGMSQVSFSVAPLAVPETAVPLILDGSCDDPGYQDAPQLPLTPYTDGSRVSAHIIHTSSKLWLCLTGLQAVDGYAGLLVDADNSGEVSVQNSDFGYFVQQDGTRFVQEGNGSAFGTADADNLSARIFDNGATWSAELQISKTAFDSWQKRLSLAIGHFEQTDNGAVVWPRSAALPNPQSWAETNIGLVSALTAVAPETAVVNSGNIALTVSGANFDNNHVVLWNGAAVATTFVDTETLTAIVPTNLAVDAGSYGVSVGMDGIDGLTTARSAFTLNNPQPIIVNLSPSSAEIGDSDKTVTINGTNFVNGATAIWNGEPHATSFVNGTELRIQVTAAELADISSAPVVVLNPEPSVGPSNVVFFDISSNELFLPFITR